MLTRPGKSEAEVKAETCRCRAEGKQLWSQGRGQRCRRSYKNTVYERLHSNRPIKFVNTKKSLPVWQSQQRQCTVQKLTSIEYHKANNKFPIREEHNVMTWFRWLTYNEATRTTFVRTKPVYCMRTRTRPDAAKQRPKILASRPLLPRT